MIRALTSTYDTLSTTPLQRSGVRALQISLGLMTWFRLATEWRFSRYFWGPNGLGFSYVRLSAPLHAEGWMRFAFATDARVQIFLALTAIAAFALIVGRATRLATLALFVLVHSLQSRLPDLTDGGDNVAVLLVFYLLFVMGPRERAAPGSARVFVHNLGVLLIAGQVLVIYVAAAFYKFEGPRWQNGTALYSIAQVDRFSVPIAREAFKNAWLCTIATYGTLFFQVLFPVAMFSRMKKAWLAMGIGMHVGIALMMGLIPFSTIMIGLELFLLTDGEYGAIGRKIEAARRAWRISRSLPARGEVVS